VQVFFVGEGIGGFETGRGFEIEEDFGCVGLTYAVWN
jgi:hypothetical protein